MQNMKDWAQTFWCCGASDGKSWNSPVVPRLERNSARSTAQLRTVWPRGAAKKKKKTDEEENEILEYDSQAVMKNRMSHFWTTRPDVMMVTLSLERETHYLRGRFFPLWRKYSLQQQNCVQLTFRSFPCYGSNGIAVTFFFVLCTCWHFYSFPWYWPVFTYMFIRDRS